MSAPGNSSAVVRLLTRPAFSLLTLGMALTVATPVRAQDSSVAFVHGFNSNGATWQLAADRLARDFRIRPHRPDLPWELPYANQAPKLENALPSPTLMAVGHSNGGMVSRQWNRVYERNDRIATLGTPHRGGMLAENFLDGDVYRYGGHVASSISAPMRYYTPYWREDVENEYGRIFFGALERIFRFGENIGHHLATLGFAAGQGTGVLIPVYHDMSPERSEIIRQLNAPENITREQQAMFARVGIVSLMPSVNNIMFHTIFPSNARSWITARSLSWASAMGAYEYYEYGLDPYNPHYQALHGGSALWLWAALMLQDMDAQWCALTGTLLYYQRYNEFDYEFECEPSDGIVSASSQRYPGGSRQRTVLNGPTHTREKTHPRVIDEIAATIREDFQIRPILPGEPRRVEVRPSTATVMVGVATGLSAFTYDSYNTLLGNQAIFWRSSNPSVATVTGSSQVGTVTGVAPGTTLIIAENSGYADTTVVTVVPYTTLSGVGIEGPDALRSDETGSWYASVSGGSAPLHFQWTVNRVDVPGNDYPTLTHTQSGLRMQVSVRVTDATGTSVSATKYVSMAPD